MIFNAGGLKGLGKMKSALVRGRLLFASLLALAAAPAFAVDIDVSTVTTALGTAAAPVGVIGLAMLVAIVGPKVYKIIRRAL